MIRQRQSNDFRVGEARKYLFFGLFGAGKEG